MTRNLVLAVALLLIVSCEDAPGPTVQAPTAPVAVVVPIIDARAILSQAAAQKRTRVCMSYLRERSKLQVSLARTPNDTTVQRQAVALASIITDACN